MSLKRRALALSLAGVMALGMMSCGKSSNKTSYEQLDDEDDTVYSVGVIQSKDNTYFNQVTQGFTDALKDTIGEKHLDIASQVISTEHTGQSIATGYISAGSQLIFANGDQALSAASMSTDELPIVGAGVMDYQGALHILTDGNKAWNKETGTNVTGVSSAPNMSDTLSLIIEATTNLQTVGILYSPDDENALFINHRLENYLDQAGIPWKEYAIDSTASAIASEQATEATGAIITPSRNVMASAKEGSNTQLESIGDLGVLSGVISPVSAHTPQISQYWFGGKNSLKPDGFVNNGGDVEQYATQLDENATTEDIVNYAANECSALYISAGSMLTDQAEAIGNVATAAGVATISGDPDVGQYTLASLFTDPYNQGYQAGKMAYKILVDGQNPGEMDVKGISRSAEQKLYQGSIASTLGMTFPKSFTEINAFLESYQPGDFTTRKTSEE